MKNTSINHILSVLTAVFVLAFGHSVFADEVTKTTTTTTLGTISEFSPDTIVVRTESSSTPVRYTYTKKTVYVDEAGAPVSLEMVKSGLPVTVHYVKDGDRMVADRVIVRKQTTVEEPAKVIEKKSTTTTTTEK